MSALKTTSLRLTVMSDEKQPHNIWSVVIRIVDLINPKHVFTSIGQQMKDCGLVKGFFSKLWCVALVTIVIVYRLIVSALAFAIIIGIIYQLKFLPPEFFPAAWKLITGIVAATFVAATYFGP